MRHNAGSLFSLGTSRRVSLYWLATCFFSSPAAGWRGAKTVHCPAGTLSFFTSYRLSVPLKRPAASHLPSGLMASACTHSGW